MKLIFLDIDDWISDLFSENFVLVDRFHGLNEDIYNKALILLN